MWQGCSVGKQAKRMPQCQLITSTKEVAFVVSWLICQLDYIKTTKQISKYVLFDKALGFTGLKGTVGPWQRYALYWESYLFIICLNWLEVDYCLSWSISVFHSWCNQMQLVFLITHSDIYQYSHFQPTEQAFSYELSPYSTWLTVVPHTWSLLLSVSAK